MIDGFMLGGVDWQMSGGGGKGGEWKRDCGDERRTKGGKEGGATEYKGGCRDNRKG